MVLTAFCKFCPFSASITDLYGYEKKYKRFPDSIREQAKWEVFIKKKETLLH